ncbi:MAG: hypothetical protein KJ792_02600 [Actinobacteria bacterium]|nr:hypothetical protein [Actinomycetota bacterium]MCG2802912.1 hypothetical protein [Cellulomonas sp.]
MTPQTKVAAVLYALWFVALLVVVVRAGRIGRGQVPRMARFAVVAVGVLGVLVVWAMTWLPVFVDIPAGRAQCIAEPAAVLDDLGEPDCVGPVLLRAVELGVAAGVVVGLVLGLLILLSRRRTSRAG